MAVRRPTAAFVLSLLGGLIILFVGGVIAIAGAITSFVPGTDIISDIGAIGILVGLLIMLLAIVIYTRPGASVAGGVGIILLAFVSIPFTLGGFGLGFLLALIGGILALVWKPGRD